MTDLLRPDSRPAPAAAGPVRPGSRLDTLTSLRFVAALLVFGVHADRQVHPHVASLLLRAPLLAGPLGVSFFYLLSGFVLTWSARPHDTVRGFWVRRLARVYPSHLIAWLAALVLLVGVVHEHEDWGTVLPSLTLTQAWWPDTHVVLGVNGVSWSLSAELFFYACFPFLLPRLRALGSPGRRRLMAAVVVLIALVDLAVATRADLPGLADPRSALDWLLYTSPPFRALEFVLGVCLALELLDGWRTRLGLGRSLLLAGAAVYVAGLTRHPHLCVALTVVPFLLVIAAATQSDLSGRPSLLRRPVPVRLGEWSFAFYLVHQLVLRFGARHHVHSLGQALAFVAVQFCVALALAAALHHVVERPAERVLRVRYAGPPAVPLTDADGPASPLSAEFVVPAQARPAVDVLPAPVGSARAGSAAEARSRELRR